MAIFTLFIILNIAQTLELRTTTFTFDTRIVGGQAVERREDFPYQVSIRVFRQHYCGGSIITSQHVLTAAHCCFGSDHQPYESECYTVVAGDLDLRGTSMSVERDVIAVTYHEQYSPRRLRNDIAVMKVKRFPDCTKFICKISLAINPPQTGTVCVVSGWGSLTESGPSTTELQMLNVPVLSMSLCKMLYRKLIKDGMFCAGYIEGGKDSCQGDSGGPLVDNGLLYGVVSWGEGCARYNKPGVYTDVAYFREWILEIGLKGQASSWRFLTRTYLYFSFILVYLFL